MPGRFEFYARLVTLMLLGVYIVAEMFHLLHQAIERPSVMLLAPSQPHHPHHCDASLN